MEQKKNFNVGVYNYVSRIVTPKFEQVLKEVSKNPMSVGKPGFKRNQSAHYQPHNFRLWIDFLKVNFKPQNRASDPGLNDYKVVNSKEHFFFYDNFNIKVKKTQVEILNKCDHKRWYVIAVGHKSKDQIIDILRKKDSECVEFLKNFIKIYGGKSQFQILNRRIEDKVQHEDKLNLLPKKMAFHNEIVKKVYNEPNVEFSDSVFTCNFLTNRALEDLSPELVKSINRLSKNIETVSPLRALKIKVKNVEDVLRNSHLVKLLTPLEKNQFERWLFCI